MRGKLKVKPLSVNSANALDKKKYKAKIKKQLPKRIELTKEKLFINYDIYISNESADLNNYIKITQDAICEAYNLQDSNIYEQHERKFITKKGKEKIIFTLEPLSTFRFKRYWMPRISYFINFAFILIIYLLNA